MSSAPPLTPRDRWSPLTITLVYRGGAEAWYQIRARGRVWHFPGHLCLHDCVEAVNLGRGGKVEEPQRRRDGGTFHYVG